MSSSGPFYCILANFRQGVHWSLIAVGFGVYGFVLASISGISLSYLMDCYQDVSFPSGKPFADIKRAYSISNLGYW